MSVIQIFAKPPVKGKVKTRLIPDIGADNATEVFRHCLKHTIETVKTISSDVDADVQIWLSEASKDNIFGGMDCRIQQGSDLGMRMLNAIKSQLSPQANQSILLVGSDCIDLNQGHFHQAFAALKTNDIVLLPTVDGGFALIGCRVIDPLLFHDVQWSSSLVLKQTIDNAKQLKYKVHLLEIVRDIDTFSDLSHYSQLLSIIEPS